MYKSSLFVLSLVFASLSAFADEAATEQGKKCFDSMVALEAAYDSKAIDMISDNADVEFITVDAQGAEKIKKIKASSFKRSSLDDLPKLKASNEKHTYSNIKILPEGKNYRVTGKDYSSGEKMSTAFSSLFVTDEKHDCSIKELKITFAPNTQQRP